MAQEMMILIRTAFFGALAGVLGWFLVQNAPTKEEPAPIVMPVPAPAIKPKPKRILPRLREAEGLLGKVTIGGPVAPDGKTEVACDLPVDQRLKNVGGRDGAGLCVFTSITHSARWQNERRLFDFQAKMRAEPGGGYPQKVDRMIAKYAPGVAYVQYEGKDPSILKLAIKTGRMPAVTWDGYRDPHYGGHRIAHMVNCLYLDDQWCCLLDNNFIGEKELLWMSTAEFLRGWTGGGSQSGWAVICLSPPPPPPPRN